MSVARQFYVKPWPNLSEDKKFSVQLTRGGRPVPGVQPERLSMVEEEVMRWHKANHIHFWFVENVQDGEDDCGTYYIGWDKLRELQVLCEKVIAASILVDGTVDAGTRYDREHPNGLAMRSPGKVIKDASVAKELLPRFEGFFFGSYEYDEDYLQDVIETHDWIISMLADKDAGTDGNLNYHSSW